MLRNANIGGIHQARNSYTRCHGTRKSQGRQDGVCTGIGQPSLLKVARLAHGQKGRANFGLGSSSSRGLPTTSRRAGDQATKTERVTKDVSDNDTNGLWGPNQKKDPNRQWPFAAPSTLGQNQSRHERGLHKASPCSGWELTER